MNRTRPPPAAVTRAPSRAIASGPAPSTRKRIRLTRAPGRIVKIFSTFRAWARNTIETPGHASPRLTSSKVGKSLRQHCEVIAEEVADTAWRTVPRGGNSLCRNERLGQRHGAVAHSHAPGPAPRARPAPSTRACRRGRRTSSRRMSTPKSRHPRGADPRFSTKGTRTRARRSRSGNSGDAAAHACVAARSPRITSARCRRTVRTRPCRVLTARFMVVPARLAFRAGPYGSTTTTPG